MTGLNSNPAQPSQGAHHSDEGINNFAFEQSGAAYLFRLNRRRWEDIENESLVRPAMLAVGAWLLLAWARFGTQAYSGPRALTRYILVGIYSWLGLSLLLWLAGRWRDQKAGTPTTGGFADVELIVGKVGQAHQPLAIGALLLQLFQVLPFQIVNTAIAFIAIGWMGAQLPGAAASYEQRSVTTVAATTLAAWLLWLGTAGWYLWGRLGHLI